MIEVRKFVSQVLNRAGRFISTKLERDFILEFRRLVAIIVGLIVIGGIMEFRRVKTTVNPINPNLASTIVTSGVYRFTRNPMYFGMFLLLTAFSIKYLNILSPIFLTGYIVYMNRFQIIPEEKALTEKFGDDYLEYKRSVRRWI